MTKKFKIYNIIRNMVDILMIGKSKVIFIPNKQHYWTENLIFLFKIFFFVLVAEGFTEKNFVSLKCSDGP